MKWSEGGWLNDGMFNNIRMKYHGKYNIKIYTKIIDETWCEIMFEFEPFICPSVKHIDGEILCLKCRMYVKIWVSG